MYNILIAINTGIRRYAMEEKHLQPSRDNLIAFLDFVAEKGLMKRNTAVTYKKACSVILKVLGETEGADLSKIDLESVFRRHRNLAAGRIPPATLKAYEVRTRAAINTFIEYVKDPSSWKPSVQQRGRGISTVKRTKSSSLASKSQESEKIEGATSQPS